MVIRIRGVAGELAFKLQEVKNILVPVDFSACSESAFRVAADIAGRSGAVLHLYHSAPLHPYWEELSREDRESYRSQVDAVSRLSKSMEELKTTAERHGVRVELQFSHGHLIENVVNYCQRYSIDLLVMGTHGMTGIREWIIGSNTQKILRQVSCPVLAIKHDILQPAFKKIAFVSDFRPGTPKAFEKMLDFARIFNAEVTLANMDEPGFFSESPLATRKSMRHFQEDGHSRGCPCHLYRLQNGSLEHSLQKLIEEEGIDLVVIPTHVSGSFFRVFSAGFAESVVNHMDVPVMTMLIA